MPVNLTDSQKNLVKWLVEKAQAGKLKEEFYVYWPADDRGSRIKDMPPQEGEEFPHITKSALIALEKEKLLIYQTTGRDSARCSLISKAFAVVANDFQETGALITDLQEILLKLHKNLSDLRDREAREAGQPSLKLVNEIGDHLTAIRRTQQLRLGAIGLQNDLGPLSIDPDLKARLISILGEK